MRIASEMITPKKALEWLKLNHNNRPLSSKVVSKYAALMRAGKWRLNGESIKFTINGDLIDGQHRLAAIVESGVSVECYVVRGLEHEAFDTVDQGRSRTSGDVLARRGEKHYNMLASATAMYLQLFNEKRISKAGGIRPDQISDCLEQHPGLRDACDFAAGRKTNLIPASIVAAFFYVFGTIDQQAANEFWTRVMDGEGLTKAMPEFLIRARLIDNANAIAKLGRADIAALCIKAWNARITGKLVKCLKWAEAEDFPLIERFKYAN